MKTEITESEAKKILGQDVFFMEGIFLSTECYMAAKRENKRVVHGVVSYSTEDKNVQLIAQYQFVRDYHEFVFTKYILTDDVSVYTEIVEWIKSITKETEEKKPRQEYRGLNFTNE